MPRLSYQERQHLIGRPPLGYLADVAVFLGLSERAVERLDIPRVVIGGSVRFHMPSVEEWARRRQTPQLPEQAPA